MRHCSCVIALVVGLGCGNQPSSIVDAPPSIDSPPGVCGDGRCSPDETSTSCPGDCGGGADDAFVAFDTGVDGGAPGEGVTPGGMAASYSYFVGGPFREMTFPIEVVEAPVSGATYYWAQTFYFGTTDKVGYTGLQTGSGCGGGRVGKRAIFSIWDATGAVAGPRATCEKFGGEGVGYHCCAAFEWREGVVYRFTVREVAASQWELSVHDPVTAGDVVLGTITASAPYGRLATQTTGFVEYFTQVDACNTTPHARARLFRPTADGFPANSVQVTTYGTCMQQARATCSGTACF